MHGWILDFPSEFFLFEQPIGSLIFQRLSNDYVILSKPDSRGDTMVKMLTMIKGVLLI